jgi:hypothetical protein
LRSHLEEIALPSEMARHTLQDQLRDRLRKIAADAGQCTTLVTFRLTGLARSRGVRYEHLEAELTGSLRHEFGFGTPPVWTAAVEISPPASLPAPWYEEDTLMGDFLRLMRDVQEDEQHDLELEALLVGPAKESAEPLVRWHDAHERHLMLQDAALLGVDLLRSGDMNFDSAALAGAGLSKETPK